MRIVCGRILIFRVLKGFSNSEKYGLKAHQKDRAKRRIFALSNDEELRGFSFLGQVWRNRPFGARVWGRFGLIRDLGPEFGMCLA